MNFLNELPCHRYFVTLDDKVFYHTEQNNDRVITSFIGRKRVMVTIDSQTFTFRHPLSHGDIYFPMIWHWHLLSDRLRHVYKMVWNYNFAGSMLVNGIHCSCHSGTTNELLSDTLIRAWTYIQHIMQYVFMDMHDMDIPYVIQLAHNQMPMLLGQECDMGSAMWNTHLLRDFIKFCKYVYLLKLEQVMLELFLVSLFR